MLGQKSSLEEFSSGQDATFQCREFKFEAWFKFLHAMRNGQKKKTPVKRDQILGSWELREHWGNDCSEDSLEMKNKDNLGLGMNSLSDNFLPNSYTPVLPVFREGGLCDGAPEHRTMAIFISHVSSTGKLDKSGLICGHFCVVF